MKYLECLAPGVGRASGSAEGARGEGMGPLSVLVVPSICPSAPRGGERKWTTLLSLVPTVGRNKTPAFTPTTPVAVEASRTTCPVKIAVWKSPNSCVTNVEAPPVKTSALTESRGSGASRIPTFWRSSFIRQMSSWTVPATCDPRPGHRRLNDSKGAAPVFAHLMCSPSWCTCSSGPVADRKEMARSPSGRAGTQRNVTRRRGTARRRAPWRSAR